MKTALEMHYSSKGLLGIAQRKPGKLNRGFCCSHRTLSPLVYVQMRILTERKQSHERPNTTNNNIPIADGDVLYSMACKIRP